MLLKRRYYSARIRARRVYTKYVLNPIYKRRYAKVLKRPLENDLDKVAWLDPFIPMGELARIQGTPEAKQRSWDWSGGRPTLGINIKIEPVYKTAQSKFTGG